MQTTSFNLILLLAGGCLAVHAQPRIVGGPVGDAATTTAVRITWATDVASSGEIHFGATSALGAVNTLAEGDAKVHSWYISGLKPGTQYYYKVCSSLNGSETCSSVKTTSTLPGPKVQSPIAPSHVVLPSITSSVDLMVDATCSNLPSLIASLPRLTGTTNYEIRIPAGTTCYGQWEFPARPQHQGWVVVRSHSPESAFGLQGQRVAANSSALARLVTNAIPGHLSNLVSFPTYCSPGSFQWGADTPGMGLFVCEAQGTSSRKTASAVVGGATGVVLTVPGHAFRSGQIVAVSGTGIPAIDNRSWRISVLSSDTFSLDGAAASATSARGSVLRNNAWIQVRHTSGTTLPAGCSPHDWFFKTDVTPATRAAYWCTSPNVWTNAWAVATPLASESAAIQFAEGATKYRFLGLEVTHIPVPSPAPASWSEYPHKAGNFGSLIATNQSNSNIVIDRCDIHGLDYPARLGAGIYMNGSNIAVVNSRIHKVNRWTSTGERSGSEATGISIGLGPGPGRIENNLIEAVGINIFFSGSGYEDAPPSDYQIRRNHISQPDKYLYGSPYNESGKNYMTRQLLEFKSARRVNVEGNVFDGAWADVTQGAMVLITPRAGGIPPVRTITRVSHGAITVASPGESYRPGMLVWLAGTGTGNHDGIYTVDTVASKTSFTIKNPPQGAGSTGSVSLVGSDPQTSDINVHSNIFRNGPNVLWILGHNNNTSLNTKATHRVRFANNLLEKIDARAASLGGRVSPISSSSGGRSGIAVFVALGMESLIVRNNTIYDLKGNSPSFFSFDSTDNGANGGLEVIDNVYISTPATIASISGTKKGTPSFDLQWTEHPVPSWAVSGNFFCCSTDPATKSSMPAGNTLFPSKDSIPFVDPASGNFRLVPGGLPPGLITTTIPGVNMDTLEAALKP